MHRGRRRRQNRRRHCRRRCRRAGRSAPASARRPAGRSPGSGRATSSTSRVQTDRGESQIVRRQQDRDASVSCSRVSERGDFELVPQIERRRRLVEQEHDRCPVAAVPWHAAAPLRRSGLATLGLGSWARPCPIELRERRRDHDALLLAAAERAERAVGERGRAGRLERRASPRRRSAGPSISNAPRCG